MTPDLPTRPGEPATFVSTFPPPVVRAADPRLLPVPRTRWVAVVVWPTVLLTPLWGLAWFVVNWTLTHCPEWGHVPDASVAEERMALMLATLVWMSPSLIGYALARIRGGPHHFQLPLAAGLFAVGALAAWRLSPIVLCIS